MIIFSRSVVNCYFSNFSFKKSNVVFQGLTLFRSYLRNGWWSDWCETKKKNIGWILGIICDLDLWPFINVNWKGNELIGYWADCMTLPFDHTNDIYLGVSRSEFEIAVSQEWDEKDVSHPFMTMIWTSVTMVGWAHVQNSDRGDLRRRRAVDISSFQ